MKCTKTFTIEHEIYEAARATGSNLSNVVEQALAAHADVHKDEVRPHLFDLFTDSDEDNKWLNEMIHRCSYSFPGVCKRWSEMTRVKFDFKIDYYELHKLCKEMLDETKNT